MQLSSHGSWPHPACCSTAFSQGNACSWCYLNTFAMFYPNKTSFLITKSSILFLTLLIPVCNTHLSATNSQWIKTSPIVSYIFPSLNIHLDYEICQIREVNGFLIFQNSQRAESTTLLSIAESIDNQIKTRIVYKMRNIQGLRCRTL